MIEGILEFIMAIFYSINKAPFKELGNQYDYTTNSYFDSILFAKSFDMTMYGDYKSCRTIVFRNAIDIDGVKEVHVDGKIFHMS